MSKSVTEGDEKEKVAKKKNQETNKKKFSLNHEQKNKFFMFHLFL